MYTHQHFAMNLIIVVIHDNPETILTKSEHLHQIVPTYSKKKNQEKFKKTCIP